MENNNPQNNPQPPVFIPDTKVENRSHLDKLAEVFLPEDLNSIGNNIVNQIMIPAILQTAGDIIHRSIDMIFGTNYTGAKYSQPQSSSVTNWTTYQAQTRNTNQQPVGTLQILPVRSGVYDYSIVRFKTVQDAQRVLNNMRVVLQNTGQCSVGKYLEFAGAKTIPEDFNYGWVNLTTVKLENTGDQQYPFRMVLPNPIALPKQSDSLYI